ncbi:RidA family protein [Paraburkholderia oxyphila]|uniref:RidA family protein n=1 Tax=Paraburkholderia oxyphila TaxID=614212 RepID=UPI00047FD840|nr:RidA family protein [Paraburkholderia oxyphila]
MATTTKRQSIIPPPFQGWYDEYHFSPAIRVGDAIWVSGQVGATPDGKVGEDIRAQTRIAFESLKAVLEAAGANLADVVELTTFHTDIQGGTEAFSAVKDEYFPDRYPSWTAVGTTQLSIPGLYIEIRAVAVAGSGGT